MQKLIRKVLLLPVVLGLLVLSFDTLHLQEPTKAAIADNQWTDGGKVLQTTGDEIYPDAVITASDGNTIVKTHTYTSGPGWDNYIQKFDENGDEMWTAGGVNMNYNDYFSTDVLLYSSTGDLIFLGMDFSDRDVFLQRIATDGTPAYGTLPLLVNDTGLSYQHKLQVARDDAGGFYLTWIVDNGTNYDLYGQRFTSTGTPLWTPTGVSDGKLLKGGLTYQYAYRTKIFTASDGGAFVVWPNAIQKYNSSGVAQLGTGVTFTLNGWLVNSIKDSADNIYVLERIQNISPRYDHVYLHKLNSSGTKVWDPNGIYLGENADNTTEVGEMKIDTNGDIFIVWGDDYPIDVGYGDIYGQKVDSSDGSKYWATDGVPLIINEETHDAMYARFLPDNNGGMYVFSEEFDHTTPDDDYDEDIFVQYVGPSGNIIRSKGDFVGDTQSWESMYAVWNENSNSAIAVWWDPTTVDLYGQSFGSYNQISNLPTTVDVETSSFDNVEEEGPSSTLQVIHSETFNLTDSPAGGDYTQDMYAEHGWTGFTATNGFSNVEIEVQMDVITDNYPEEFRVYAETPDGTQITIYDATPLSDGVTETINKTVSTSENPSAGTWKFWGYDTYGDGGCALANITVTVQDGLGTPEYDGIGLVGTGHNLWLKQAPNGCYLGKVMNVDMTTDRNWGQLVASCNRNNYWAYSKNHGTLPGKNGNFKLEVAKGTGHDRIRFCPGAEAEGDITIDCTGGTTYQESDTNVTVVDISGQSYWEIDNAIDGGALSYDSSNPPAGGGEEDPAPEEDPTPTEEDSVPVEEDVPPIGEGDNPVVQDEVEFKITEQTEEYGDGEVEVCWETNKESKGKVEYGIHDGDNTEYTEEILIEEYGLSHCVTLTALEEESTEYEYKITAETGDGEIAEIERMITIYPVEEPEEERVDVIDVVAEPGDDEVVVRYETNYPSICEVRYGYTETNHDHNYASGEKALDHVAYLTTTDFPEGADLYGQIGCDVYKVEGEAPSKLVKSLFVARDSLKEQVTYEEEESWIPGAVGIGLAAVAAVLGGAMIAVYPNSIVYAFGWLRNKKKRRPWGLVYDRGENKPVAFAVVELYKGEEFIQKVVTDLEGRYMLPVEPGSYRVVAKQSGYEEAVEEINVTEPRSANLDIGLTKDGNSSMVYTLRKVLPKVNRVIFTVGFLISLVITVLYFNWINLAILIFYGIQIITWYMMKSPRGTGFVYQSGTGKKVKGTIVKVHDAEDLGVEDSQMTNEEGRYGFILKDGEYRLSLSGRGYEIDEEEARRNMRVERQGEEIYIVAQIVKGDFVDIAIPVKPSQIVSGFTQ